jgi:prepilin-type N-terminal cleavage/methylation domain-containing protein
MLPSSTQKGFTIVELLIVVVVIAILAAITIVSYNGIQARAQQAKIDSDLTTLNKAILAARNNKGEVAMKNITNSQATGSVCWTQPSGTNLANLDEDNLCIKTYKLTLDALSNASSMNVRNILDPWGRPYYIDENEGENAASPCNPDKLGVYSQPFITGWSNATSVRTVPLITKGC